MPRNFDFVSFPEKVNNNYLNNIKNRYGKYSGAISLQIKTVDDLYTGSGFIDYDPKNGLTTSTDMEEGKAIIPGSSVKGALRHVARAVSDGCIISSEASRDLKLSHQQEKGKCKLADGKSSDKDAVCIICDMFGMMGLASKLIVSDFGSVECKLVKRNVPTQFTPSINSPYYKDGTGKHKGYKFYYTNCDPTDGSKYDVIYAVAKGTQFTGEIRFNGLDENELCLLMYCLGFEDKDGGRRLSHKLGGYRAVGFGTVNFTCQRFLLNEEEIPIGKAADYAHKYTEICSDDCYARIDTLEKIMEYRDK